MSGAPSPPAQPPPRFCPLLPSPPRATPPTPPHARHAPPAGVARVPSRLKVFRDHSEHASHAPCTRPKRPPPPPLPIPMPPTAHAASARDFLVKYPLAHRKPTGASLCPRACPQEHHADGTHTEHSHSARTHGEAEHRTRNNAAPPHAQQPTRTHPNTLTPARSARRCTPKYGLHTAQPHRRRRCSGSSTSVHPRAPRRPQGAALRTRNTHTMAHTHHRTQNTTPLPRASPPLPLRRRPRATPPAPRPCCCPRSLPTNMG